MDSSERLFDTLVSSASDNNQCRGGRDAMAEAAVVAGFVGQRWLRVHGFSMAGSFIRRSKHLKRNASGGGQGGSPGLRVWEGGYLFGSARVRQRWSMVAWV
nr:hypothetical protein Iba_chr07dCG5430 [Ipomoea batatas]